MFTSFVVVLLLFSSWFVDLLCCSTAFFNVGSGVGTTVRDAVYAVTQEVFRQTDKIIEMKVVPWPANSPKIDMRNFIASIDKANACLGWHPKVSLQAGIATTVKSMILQNLENPTFEHQK